ncbi:hypothetical protein BJ944DRAFT_209188 [Cunninghamella echinulata]|nr:hypothetical protein BJ944DRAFT_209188 [Cunninghamella echinulata]
MKQAHRPSVSSNKNIKSGQQSLFSKAMSKIEPKQKGMDPSDIVITKKITQQQRSSYAAEPRHSNPVIQRSLPIREKTVQPVFRTTRPESNFAIRGLSGNNTSLYSIRGESGPTSVIISNLDPQANAADVTTACSQFGEVTACEVFKDRSGRSIGEAEVEFSTKAAALDCIAKLDNEIADGQVLRVILREKPVIPATQIRSQLSSNIRTFPSSGKLYADQMVEDSRYEAMGYRR